MALAHPGAVEAECLALGKEREGLLEAFARIGVVVIARYEEGEARNREERHCINTSAGRAVGLRAWQRLLLQAPPRQGLTILAVRDQAVGGLRQRIDEAAALPGRDRHVGLERPAGAERADPPDVPVAGRHEDELGVRLHDSVGRPERKATRRAASSSKSCRSMA